MSLRLLTSGEIALARTIFEDTINYAKVWVHNESYFPFGLQSKLTAVTPNGEMYYPDDVYRRDFSDVSIMVGDNGTIKSAHMFIHEMTHVWQFQKGYLVKLHGLFSWAADYTYDLDASSLIPYSMEQQASIIADYWLLKFHSLSKDERNVRYRGNIFEGRYSLIRKYKRVLGMFPRCVI